MEGMQLFSRQSIVNHRDRAALDLKNSNFLFSEVAKQLVERLDEIKRQFPTMLDLGCRSGQISTLLDSKKKIETIIQADLSYSMAKNALRTGNPTLVCDEEYLPFREKSFDAVLSNLNLHWVNDLPGTFSQICHILKPDSLFLASMFGTGTLFELQDSLANAEKITNKVISPRISPLSDIKDIGQLLLRVGFKIPVLDNEKITVRYSSPIKLMHDLRSMGETNALIKRQSSFMRRDTLAAVLEHYLDVYGDNLGRVPATFQIITLVAWSPGPDQPKPLKPGHPSVNLADFLNS